MRIWLAGAILAAILPQFALAQGYVGCVQSQLDALGHDVGPVDGRLGPRSLRASSAAQADDLPPLTKLTAYDWCRGLSERDIALRAHWPSLKRDVLVIPPDMLGTAAEDLSRTAHEDARAFFLARYGLELVGSFGFLVGDQSETLENAALAFRNAKNEPNNFRFDADPMPCSTNTIPRAIAFRDMALFCWMPVDAYDAEWAARNKDLYTRSFVHEYAHGLQNELSGANARARMPSGEPVLGPKWLVEGAAETVEEEHYALVTRYSERSLGRQRKIILGIDTPLSSLRNRVSIGSDYDVSQFAAFLLGERFGRDALFDYFDALRRADSWDAAFRATFDMPLAAFEDEFQTLRTDLVAAYKFGKGE